MRRLYPLVFSHLELIHCHGVAQLVLPWALAKGATVSPAGRRCAGGYSENGDGRKRGGRVERDTFPRRLWPTPYFILCISFQPELRVCSCAL